MKKLIILFLLFTPYLLADGNNLGSATMQTYQLATAKWWSVFQAVSLYIFWFLAVIELTIVLVIKKLLKDLDLMTWAIELMKIALLFGFFQFFLGNQILDVFFLGFSELAGKASPSATLISIDTLTAASGNLLNAINEEQSWWKPADSILLGFIGLIAALSILYVGIALLVTYVKFLILLNLSILFMGFGAWEYTRQWAINGIINLIKVSIEYMLLKLVIGLYIDTIKIQAPIAMKSEGSLFALLITVLIIAGIVKMVPSLVESFFTGHGPSSNDSASGILKGSAMGAAAGAVGGAMGAISATKTASAAATSSSSPTVPGMSGTGSKPNFMKSPATSAVAGAAMGAASGAIKGALGFNTHNAGQKTGGAMGAAFSKMATTPSDAMSNAGQNTTSSSSLNGTISSSGEKNEK